MKIEKRVKKSLKKLYSQYKTGLNGNCGGWLYDNYYVFEREGRA